MMLRATVAQRGDDQVPLLVDSSRPFPLLLQDGAWSKAGVDVHTLLPMPDDPGIKRGVVPVFRVGGFDLAKMPAIEGVDMAELTSGLDVDLGGIVGADLLSFFRITFADDGRFMWLEPDPTLLGAAQQPGAGAGAPPPRPPASGAPPAPGAEPGKPGGSAPPPASSTAPTNPASK
jgi:hypothetical protein